MLQCCSNCSHTFCRRHSHSVCMVHLCQRCHADVHTMHLGFCYIMYRRAWNMYSLFNAVCAYRLGCFGQSKANCCSCCKRNSYIIGLGNRDVGRGNSIWMDHRGIFMLKNWVGRSHDNFSCRIVSLAEDGEVINGCLLQEQGPLHYMYLFWVVCCVKCVALEGSVIFSQSLSLLWHFVNWEFSTGPWDVILS